MTNEDRRTLRTRAALRAAFVAQVLEHGYAGVRVEHIAAAADTGRATFYTHFRDKEALYDHVVEVVLGELRERMTPADWEGVGFTGRPVAELFRHAAEQPDVYRLILRGEGDGRGLRALVDAWTAAAYDIFAERAETQRIRPRVDLRVVARAWVGEQVSVLLWWLELPAPRPGTEQVVETLVELSRRGRYWATGFDSVPT